MPERDHLWIDTETSGLDDRTQWVVEVSWINETTGEADTFVPLHPTEYVLRFGEPEALKVNRYRERLLNAPQDTTREHIRRMHDQLRGNTLAGANPGFDARFLMATFREIGLKPDPWHHRPLCVENYAMAVLGLDYVPGMDEVYSTLGVTPGDHSAQKDVEGELACYLQLRAIRAILLRVA